MSLSVSQKLKHCTGCHDNFYNNGGNSLKKDGLCWSIHSAKLVMRKRVHIHQRPPWNQKAQKYLDCIHGNGYVYIAPGATN